MRRVSWATENEVRAWMVYATFDSDDGRFVTGFQEDPDVDECTHPPWLSYEVSESGWDSLVGRDPHDLILWGLVHGIAPRQPFLVRIGRPHYYEINTPDCHEWDVDYDSEIVLVDPIHDAAARWDEAISEELVARESMRVHREVAWLEARTGKERMYLQMSSYFGPRQHSWDDMCMPSGVAITLYGRSASGMAHRLRRDRGPRPRHLRGGRGRRLRRLPADHGPRPRRLPGGPGSRPRRLLGGRGRRRGRLRRGPHPSVGCLPGGPGLCPLPHPCGSLTPYPHRPETSPCPPPPPRTRSPSTPPPLRMPLRIQSR